ncbi:cupin domain-containing protein [Nonomuraea ferruginea]|uniref:Cupin domain-containing protein n=1 Tax=Nonomuraea ferruginea TaxID=46174 RepID=A0ABT4SYT8_9ACTN|nr:cupin domain-containing protein [Nonomuraea ferruginea]MDA0642418.1 cupin domain-containing protein [Nonomuraea ferruginea]
MDRLRFDLSPTRILAAEITADTGQSAGAIRVAGVHRGVGASAIWLGKVSNEPAYRSVPHHHAEAETAGYVFKGRARIYFGEGYRDYYDLEEGDFVHVPPWMPHIECNRSADAELVWMTARTPDNLVVNLDDVDLPPSEYTT